MSSYVQARDPGRIGDRRGQRMQRACVRDALMWPVLVIEDLELAQGKERVPLLPDQGPVEQLTPTGLHPPLRDRVHPRHPYPGQHHLDARITQDGVEEFGKPAVPIADQEPCAEAGVFQVHDQVRAACFTHEAVG
nr:hypothetical protein GCM10010200_035690 [Actinomadura rugatobispora]